MISMRLEKENWKRNKEKKPVKLLKTADCRCQDKSLFTNTENFLSELKKWKWWIVKNLLKWNPETPVFLFICKSYFCTIKMVLSFITRHREGALVGGGLFATLYGGYVFWKDSIRGKKIGIDQIEEDPTEANRTKVFLVTGANSGTTVHK